MRDFFLRRRRKSELSAGKANVTAIITLFGFEIFVRNAEGFGVNLLF
jgi:hypothetical protein